MIDNPGKLFYGCPNFKVLLCSVSPLFAFFCRYSWFIPYYIGEPCDFFLWYDALDEGNDDGGAHTIATSVPVEHNEGLGSSKCREDLTMKMTWKIGTVEAEMKTLKCVVFGLFPIMMFCFVICCFLSLKAMI
jgi:hypothetical protein